LSIYEEHNHCRVPHLYKSTDGYRLGGWVNKQRQTLGELSADRKARLDALGFDWDPILTRWKEGYEHLKEYVTQHGHCRVPLRYKSPDGYPLGVGDRRELQNTLSAMEKQQLTSLGFIWNVYESL
jgi:Helicase associated domain